MTAGIVLPESVTFANVGDSRAYLWRGGRLHQITEDHSWKAMQALLGELSEEEIAKSPYRETITRCIGFDPVLEVDLFEGEPAVGDGLLLCSDGLYDELEEEQIWSWLGRELDSETICRGLVEAANESGGRDNISCVVARVLDPGSGKGAGRKTSDTVPLDLSGMP